MTAGAVRNTGTTGAGACAGAETCECVMVVPSFNEMMVVCVLVLDVVDVLAGAAVLAAGGVDVAVEAGPAKPSSRVR